MLLYAQSMLRHPMKKSLPMHRFLTLFLTFSALLLAAPAFAVVSTTTLHPMGLPNPVGEVAQSITWLYNAIFVISIVISVVVAGPLAYIMWKFRREKVKRPATFSHSLPLELTWTIIPAAICIFIAWESFVAMKNIRTMPQGAMNVEVVGYQFGWDFYYPDASEDGKHVTAPEPTTDDPEISLPNYPRQTKELIVPVGKPVVIHITASDVLHSLHVPELGIKIDAIPGRINYAWFNAEKPGSYLGQCTELCGQAHGEMFMRVKAVPQTEFDAFIQQRRVAAGLPATRTSPTEVISTTMPQTITPTTPISPTAP